MFFYNQKTKGVKMSASEKIQEYIEKESARKQAAENLEQKKREIADVRWFGDFTAFKRPKDKCVGQYTEEFLSYEEWRYKDEITTIKYCPEFEKKYGCKKTDCPGYQKYREYLKAKSDYDKAEREAWSYPLWVMFASLFKRQK